MVLEFLAPGFEEIEAMTPVDVLRRGGVDVKTVAVCKEGLTVPGAHGIGIQADIHLDEAKKLWEAGAVEMLILPGGMPGASNLDEDPTVDAMVRSCAEQGKLVAAICAAPMILGKRGILRGKRAVCYPGFEEYLEGALVTDNAVEEDGNVITACGMGAALDFALALLKRMKGVEEANRIAASVLKR